MLNISLSFTFSLFLCIVLGCILISFTCSYAFFFFTNTNYSFVYSCLLCHRLSENGCMHLSLGLLSYSIYFYFCSSNTLFWWLVFQYSLKSGSLLSPIPFSFWRLLWLFSVCFRTNCKHFCSNSVKYTIGNAILIALNL